MAETRADRLGRMLNVTTELFIGRERELFWDGLLQGRSAKVLDIGCGNGTYLNQMRVWYPDAEFTGVELDKEMHRQAASLEQDRLRFVQGSYEQLDGSGPYDVVIARLVVLHIRNRMSFADWLSRHTHERSTIVVIDYDDSRYRDDARLPQFSALYRKSRRALRGKGSFLDVPEALKFEFRQAGYVCARSEFYSVRAARPELKLVCGAYMRHATEYLLDAPIGDEREDELQAWLAAPDATMDIPMFGLAFGPSGEAS
ncbi:class I SAM-dependent methyltransferase [Paenibacillus hodogayensis]|uniref:Class I SAM-dependent methyltransferase n=1 Tax=Paenibacillus hodogayensis TaxID=279208 RepID=A0ABV5W512_9BACL